MKLTELERHLRQHGCEFYREGSRHSVWWNPTNRKTTAVPRHRAVKKFTASGICIALEIPRP